MNADLKRSLERIADESSPIGAGALLDRIDRQLRGEPTTGLVIPTRRASGWLVAAAAAAVTIVCIGVVLLIFGGSPSPVVTNPPTSVIERTRPPEPTTLPPSTAATSVSPSTATPSPTITTLPPSASGVIAWERAEEQESLESAALSTVAVYDGRLFAGGYVVEDSTLYDEDGWIADGAVWVSDDGLTWGQTGFPTFDADGTEEVAALVAGPEQLLAFGYRGNVGASSGARTMIWVSADGEAWEEVSGDIPDSALVYDVIWTESGWVAVGFDRIEGGGAMAWVSEDGHTWTGATVTDPLRVDHGFLTAMYSVTNTGSGLVAVGDDEAGEHLYAVGGYTRCAAAWFSETGSSWDRITAPALCEEEEYFDRVIADRAGGVLASGGYLLWGADHPADPGSWHALGGARLLPDAAVGDVAVALGLTDRLPFMSEDGGATWLEVDGSGPFEGGFLVVTDVVAFDGRFVAVGEDPVYEGLPGRGAAWVGTIER